MRRISWVAASVLALIGVGGLRVGADEIMDSDSTAVIDFEPGRSPGGKLPVITAVAVVPGGALIATAGDDHIVRLWSTTTGRIVRSLKGHNDWVRGLAFSPDGEMLASAGDDRQIMLWQVSDGKLFARLPPHPHAVYSIAYSPDGELLAAVGFEHKVRLYNPRTAQGVRELEGPGMDQRAVVFSPDGKQLAVAGRNGQILVWSMPSGVIQLEIAAGVGRIRGLAYLPEGDRLVSAGEGRTIKLWDARTGDEAYTFICPKGKVLSMAICGEDLIATGGSDNAIRVWNWQTQSEMDSLKGHTGSVATLAYDPASGKLVSGSFDTTVRVWPLKPAGSNKTTAGAGDVQPRIR